MGRKAGNSNAEISDAGNDSPIIGSDAGLIIPDNAPGGITADGLIIVDPSTIGGDDPGSDGGSNGDTSGEPRKRRGRKPGTSSARTSKTQALDINGVESILFSMHSMLAGIAATPELKLDKSEASEMAKAIGNVSRHYDVSASAKSVDWANLLMVVGMVYGPRLVAVRMRKKKEKKENPASGDVVQFPFVQ